MSRTKPIYRLPLPSLITNTRALAEKHIKGLGSFYTILASVSLFFLIATTFIAFNTSLLRSANAATGINRQISFQGKVVNINGTNVTNGNYNFVFRIYTVDTGGSPIWTETRTGGNQLTVTDGIFRASLGSVTSLPGSIDFNTDNIYLSVEFNTTDGTNEMSPRIRFSAVPYAINAEKVSGLTVTNTTGTLTIPNSKTLSIADDFSTSGAFGLTLTTTASTNVTLPTTGTLSTLAGTEILTNKSIGSTGLVFSGATTDITTATDEDFTVTVNGTGDYIINTDADTQFRLAGLANCDSIDTDASGNLACGTDAGASSSPFNTAVGVIDKATLGDRLRLRYGDVADTQLEIENTFLGSAPTADAMVIDLTGGASGIVTNGVDALSISAEFGNGTSSTNSGLNIIITPVGSPTGDETFYGLNIATLTGTSATETAVNIGAGWDTGINLNANTLVNIGDSGTDFTPTGGLTLAGALQINNTINATGTATFDGTLDANGIFTLGDGAEIGTIDTSDWDISLTGDLTGISFDANGTGNSITNIESADILDGTIAPTDLNLTTSDSPNDEDCLTFENSTTDFEWQTCQVSWNNLTAPSDNLSLSMASNTTTFTWGNATGASDMFTLTDTTNNTGTGAVFSVSTASGSTATPFEVSAQGNPAITVSSRANVGIKNINPQEALEVGNDTTRANMKIYGDILKDGYIDSTGLANVTDVFIYDTTRDSDGGAWTNGTIAQGLSWYTETKDNTSTACSITTDDRCGRSEFPKKALIISTPSAAYIFDARDNTMWMKFNQNSAGYAIGVDTNNNPTGVFALNGTVYIGMNGSAASGLYAINFTNDTLLNYDSVDRTQGDKNIANRNSAVSYATNANTAFSITDNIVNDVHGAVIFGSTTAGSPLNGGTFIAAATDSGTAVINLTAGRVIRYAGTTITNDINQVWLTRRGRLYQTNEALLQVERFNDIEADTANQTSADDIYDEQSANVPHLAKTAPTISTSPGALFVLERASVVDDQGDVLYVGHSLGLSELHLGNTVSATAVGWAKYYTIDGSYQYLSGNIRGAFAMNGASGDITDLSMRNNVLDVKNSPTYGVAGVRGKAMSFNGTNQYACSDTNNDGTCDLDADFSPAAVSFHIEAWFKHSTAISGTDVLIDHTYTTAPAYAGGYRIFMNASGQMVFGIDDDATAWGDDDVVTSTQTYNDNQWHHLVAVNTDTGICLYIDGKLAVACDTSLLATATLTIANVVLGVGADCSVGANCSTGANFWTGEIDDVNISMGGSTTSDSLTQAQVRKKYLEGRAALSRPLVQVTDATTASSTTIGDSAETWIPNQLSGSVVEITQGTGVGQTRRVVSNTATTLTVTPAFTTTPDTTSDFEIVPEQLYGATNTVTSIAVQDTDVLGYGKTLMVGTNNGSDGGGVTIFGGQGHAYITDVYHADAGKTDDNAATYSGTDYDDITAVAAKSGVRVVGNLAGFWTETDNKEYEANIDRIMNEITNMKQELLVDGITGTSTETGLMGGADLAEYYYSTELLEAGEVVAIDKTLNAGVKRSSTAYQTDVIGIVATYPGIILGTKTDNSFPIALSGRVPVKVSIENGIILAGDRLTASSVPGHAMRTDTAGRVIGVAIEDMSLDSLSACVDNNGQPITNSQGEVKKCGTITAFVNLSDYNKNSDDTLLSSWYQQQAATELYTKLYESESANQESTESATIQSCIDNNCTDNALARQRTKVKEILSILKNASEAGEKEGTMSALTKLPELLAKKITASQEIITPLLSSLVVNSEEVNSVKIKSDYLEAGSLKTDSIQANNKDIKINVAEDGKVILFGTDSNGKPKDIITFDQYGNASFNGDITAGTITADKIKANQIEGMEIVTDKLSSISKELSVLSKQSSESAFINPEDPEGTLIKGIKIGALEAQTAKVIDITALGKMFVKKSLTVDGPATFKANTFFEKLAVFINKVIFKNEVIFEQVPTFNSDTAGFAIIKEGDDRVRIKFEKEYKDLPVVNASIALYKDDDGKEKDQEFKDRQDRVLDHEYPYIVSELSTEGFTIILGKEAKESINFSWVAFAVKDAVTAGEEKKVKDQVERLLNPDFVKKAQENEDKENKDENKNEVKEEKKEEPVKDELKNENSDSGSSSSVLGASTNSNFVETLFNTGLSGGKESSSSAR